LQGRKKSGQFTLVTECKDWNPILVLLIKYLKSGVVKSSDPTFEKRAEDSVKNFHVDLKKASVF